MSTIKHLGMLLLMCGLVLMVTGCGDDDSSVSNVKTEEIAKMDLKEVRALAEKLKKEIEDKTKEMTKLEEEIPTDPLKMPGGDFKKRIIEKEDLGKTIKELTTKLDTCVARLKKEGEDVSDLEVK
jgi:hypothetical protein